jgi:hypothetical protein
VIIIIIADTSGLFALLVKNDFMHVRAKLNFAENGFTIAAFHDLDIK